MKGTISIYNNVVIDKHIQAGDIWFGTLIKGKVGYEDMDYRYSRQQGQLEKRPGTCLACLRGNKEDNVARGETAHQSVGDEDRDMCQELMLLDRIIMEWTWI